MLSRFHLIPQHYGRTDLLYQYRATRVSMLTRDKNSTNVAGVDLKAGTLHTLTFYKYRSISLSPGRGLGVYLHCSNLHSHSHTFISQNPHSTNADFHELHHTPSNGGGSLVWKWTTTITVAHFTCKILMQCRNTNSRPAIELHC